MNLSGMTAFENCEDILSLVHKQHLKYEMTSDDIQLPAGAEKQWTSD